MEQLQDLDKFEVAEKRPIYIKITRVSLCGLDRNRILCTSFIWALELLLDSKTVTGLSSESSSLKLPGPCDSKYTVCRNCFRLLVFLKRILSCTPFADDHCPQVVYFSLLGLPSAFKTSPPKRATISALNCLE